MAYESNDVNRILNEVDNSINSRKLSQNTSSQKEGYVDINNIYKNQQNQRDMKENYSKTSRTRNSKSRLNQQRVQNNKSNKKQTRKNNAKNSKGLKIGLIVTGSIILVLGLAFGAWYFFFSAKQDTFASNISVDGISISGMTYDKALRRLTDRENEIKDSIKITAKAGKDSLDFTKADFNCTFNTESILKEAMTYSQERGIKTEKKEYKLEITFGDKDFTNCASKLAEKFDKKEKNATVSSWDSANVTFEIEDGENGLKVKQEDFSKSLQKYIEGGNYSGEIEAEVEVLKPKYSKEYLSSNIYLISSFETTSTNNANGNSNMATALEACNGSIINPDDIWSFNECTGDTNQTSNGYKEAGVIVKGKHEMGVGGGICQSSTTIYNAALKAGLVVIERTCHYYKSSYVDAGLDATVDYGNLDLRLQNAYDYQMFLRCYMNGTTLCAEIYGIPNENWDEIEVHSEVTDYFDDGYTASTTRTFYKNGEEVETEVLPSSTYYTKEPGGSTDDVDSYNNGGSYQEPSYEQAEPTPEITPDQEITPEPQANDQGAESPPQ